MKIISRARRDTRLLLESAPGERFRERYQRRQACRDEPHSKLSSIYKLMYLGFGIAVFVFGIVMFPLPGPGWAICLLGLGLMAGEYALAARLLDALEILIRKMSRSLRRSTDRH